MRRQIAFLDRLAGVCVAVGMVMGASGAFTLAFQASGIGHLAQSVVALVLGTVLTVSGFAIATKARSTELHHMAMRRVVAGMRPRSSGRAGSGDVPASGRPLLALPRPTPDSLPTGR